MNPKSDALFERLKRYALRIVRLYAGLPNSGEAKILGNQVLRSGTSPGAQYAEARRAKSTKDFVSKIEGGLQELEETGYWLQLLTEANIVQQERLSPLLQETNELIRIFVTIAKNARARKEQ